MGFFGGLFKLFALLVTLPPLFSWVRELVKKHYRPSLPALPLNHKGRQKLNKKDARGNHIRTLYLRTVTGDPSILLEGSSTLGNEFFHEYNLMFTKVTHIADYAIMKYIGTDIPLLMEQEHHHAAAHHKAMKQMKKHGSVKSEPANNGKRWVWFAKILDFFLLRCGPQMGMAVSGYFEASIWAPFYFMAPYTNNLQVYHALEELEHGALTVDCLASRTTFVWKLAALIPMIVAYAVFLFAPPIMRLIVKPRLLLSPNTIPNLIHYYALATAIFGVTISSMVLNFLFMMPEWLNQHEGMYLELIDLAERRGMKFHVSKFEDYVVGAFQKKMTKTHMKLDKRTGSFAENPRMRSKSASGQCNCCNHDHAHDALTLSKLSHVCPCASGGAIPTKGFEGQSLVNVPEGGQLQVDEELEGRMQVDSLRLN